MTRLAIVEPTTLQGHEFRERLKSQPEIWDQVELFTSDLEEIGAVSEVGGRAALVQQLQSDSLRGVDLVVFCGPTVDVDALASLPATAVAVMIDPSQPLPEAIPIVSGVNSDRVVGQRILISPNPGVVLLAHLLNPLAQFDPAEVVAHLLQPASAHDQSGLDELFKQTQSILSMSDRRPQTEFGTQLAFNLLPVIDSVEVLLEQLRQVLCKDFKLALYRTQAGVFHCYSAGVFIRMDKDPGSTVVRATLAEAPHLELCEEPQLLGPIRAAASERILVGSITPVTDGGYWIWTVMDNLTCGGASNAFAITTSFATASS